MKFLDCTLRDGGYYNAWDFDRDLISDYLGAMSALPVDFVEIGFRSMPGSSGKFKGGCAFCTDEYILSLEIPSNTPKIGVMVNGADLLSYPGGVDSAIDFLFQPAKNSPVELVRIASHVDKVIETLPAIERLSDLGYKTTIQMMQIAGIPETMVMKLAKSCVNSPLDVLYFADSLGSMEQKDINDTVNALRTYWKGDLGFHAHNSMERALSNCLRAIDLGVTWIDGTVTGMGRGPGNAQTEYLAIELETKLNRKINHTALHNLINKHFHPLREKFKWGPNSFYYMAGKYGIHPTYIQTMVDDTRYECEDIIAVINHLKKTGGKHYSVDNLKAANNFFSGKPKGKWQPKSLIKDREVLLLGTGPGVGKHRKALESYIRKVKPFVMALNTQSELAPELITVRLACHPVRLLADIEEHKILPQPLITPASMLPEELRIDLDGKKMYDFGLDVTPDNFSFADTYCEVPSSLVLAYTLGVVASGKARCLLLAGFDGYQGDDPRNQENNQLFKLYSETVGSIPLIAVTPTRYELHKKSVYEMLLLEN
jgi:4-hydroxy 2-oxovalerate aldolase